VAKASGGPTLTAFPFSIVSSLVSSLLEARPASTVSVDAD
jgi:hypothetical protein